LTVKREIARFLLTGNEKPHPERSLMKLDEAAAVVVIVMTLLFSVVAFRY